MASSRILIAVSSAWASDKLVGTVSDLAERLDASVLVAHVARPTEEDDSDDETRARGDQTVTTLTDQLQAKGVTCESVILYGTDVPRAILKAAEAKHATMILLGITGRGGLMSWLGRDVGQRVLKSTSLPVLMLPAEWSGTV